MFSQFIQYLQPSTDEDDEDEDETITPPSYIIRKNCSLEARDDDDSTDDNDTVTILPEVDLAIMHQEKPGQVNLHKAKILLRKSSLVECLEELKQALKIQLQEAGKYHQATFQTCMMMGNVYARMERKAEARQAYSTALKIERMIDGERSLYQAEISMAAIDKNYKSISEEVFKYVAFEIRGDEVREQRRYRKAVSLYQQAAKLEEFIMGIHSPDLAYMWRKIALVSSVRRGHIRPIDYVRADALDHAFLRDPKSGLIEEAAKSIEAADAHYLAGNYKKATEQYRLLFAQLASRTDEESPFSSKKDIETVAQRWKSDLSSIFARIDLLVEAGDSSQAMEECIKLNEVKQCLIKELDSSVSDILSKIAAKEEGPKSLWMKIAMKK